MNKGLFISLEGIEATGKSTIAKSLKDIYGDRVLVTREPGGNAFAEKIREMIMEDGISRETELLLFLSARREHLEKVIKPALREGKIVVCDRYMHSSIAYQGHGREIGMDKVYELNHFATGGFMPNITFLIDVPVEISLKRKREVEEQNRLDQEDKAFYKKVRQAYLKMAVSNKDIYGNMKIVNGEKTIEEIIEEIKKEIDQGLKDVCNAVK